MHTLFKVLLSASSSVYLLASPLSAVTHDETDGASVPSHPAPKLTIDPTLETAGAAPALVSSLAGHFDNESFMDVFRNSKLKKITVITGTQPAPSSQDNSPPSAAAASPAYTTTSSSDSDDSDSAASTPANRKGSGRDKERSPQFSFRSIEEDDVEVAGAFFANMQEAEATTAAPTAANSQSSTPNPETVAGSNEVTGASTPNTPSLDSGSNLSVETLLDNHDVAGDTTTSETPSATNTPRSTPIPTAEVHVHDETNELSSLPPAPPSTPQPTPNPTDTTSTESPPNGK